MFYYSLKNYTSKETFEKAIIFGLYKDKGLFFPEKIPLLSKKFFKSLHKKNIYDIVYQLIYPFIGNTIPDNIIYSIISETLRFPLPIKNISKKISSMELYEGPTMAFKDIGAKFMAGCLGYFMKKKNKNITVLVATSGDTGGAVAHGFFKIDGIKVIILFPSKRVSDLQEKQLTLLSENIISLEVNSDFDECQKLVKKTFLDFFIRKKQKLTSANSINIARWLPQMFYYFIIFRDIKNIEQKKIFFSVPSGNFGNICAGLMTERMGLIISYLIASTNINDTIPRIINNNIYEPKKAKHTFSNAMDVADPSNFIRILALHSNNEVLKKHMIFYRFTDEKTIRTIQNIWIYNKYILDPHGAVALMGIIKFLKKKGKNINQYGIFFETAHPMKFSYKIKEFISKKIRLPINFNILSKKYNNYYILSSKYEEFRDFIINVI